MSEGKNTGILSWCFFESEKTKLVGGLVHGFYVSIYIGNFIIANDKLHHFSEGVGQPPTSMDNMLFNYKHQYCGMVINS